MVCHGNCFKKCTGTSFCAAHLVETRRGISHLLHLNENLCFPWIKSSLFYWRNFDGGPWCRSYALVSFAPQNNGRPSVSQTLCKCSCTVTGGSNLMRCLLTFMSLVWGTLTLELLIRKGADCWHQSNSRTLLNNLVGCTCHHAFHIITLCDDAVEIKCDSAYFQSTFSFKARQRRKTLTYEGNFIAKNEHPSRNQFMWKVTRETRKGIPNVRSSNNNWKPNDLIQTCWHF